MKRLLLVGGTNAGRFVDIDDDAEYVRITADRAYTSSAVQNHENGSKEYKIDCDVELYRLERLRTKDNEYQVLCIVGASLIGELVRGYRPRA